MSQTSRYFQEALKYHLSQQQKTHKQAAKEIGITPQTLSRIINGANDPSGESVSKILEYFDVNYADFINIGRDMLNEQGEILGKKLSSVEMLIIQLSRELDEKKEEEKSLLRLVDDYEQVMLAMLGNPNAHIIVISNDYKVVRTRERNPVADGSTAKGKTCYRALFGKTDICEKCLVAEVFATGEIKTSIVERTHTNGEVTKEHVAAFPVRNTDGEIDRVVEIINPLVMP